MINSILRAYNVSYIYIYIVITVYIVIIRCYECVWYTQYNAMI